MCHVVSPHDDVRGTPAKIYPSLDLGLLTVSLYISELVDCDSCACRGHPPCNSNWVSIYVADRVHFACSCMWRLIFLAYHCRVPTFCLDPAGMQRLQIQALLGRLVTGRTSQRPSLAAHIRYCGLAGDPTMPSWTHAYGTGSTSRWHWEHKHVY